MFLTKITLAQLRDKIKYVSITIILLIIVLAFFPAIGLR